MSDNKFVRSSFVLFLDQILIAFFGWLFWFVAARLTTSSQIGQATAILSLVILTSILSQLGLEFPLLKRSSLERSKIFGTAVFVEGSIALATIPILAYIVVNVYTSMPGMITIGSLFLFFASLGFVPRFVLLGISDVRSVFLIDIIGSFIKLGIGLPLIMFGFGSPGMVSAFMVQQGVITVSMFMVVLKKIGMEIGTFSYIRTIIAEGLVNTPAKLSRLLILSLSIVLLAAIRITDSEIGSYYIALTITIVVTALGVSMSYMILPISQRSKSDLSINSQRLGLSLTAPIVSVLLVQPNYLLGIIGPSYASSGGLLLPLSLSILPSIITMNSLSKFNNLNDRRKLLTIGSVEIASFLISFLILVHLFGIIGAGYATLIAFVSSASVSVLWSERILLKYILAASASAGLGWMIGILIVLLTQAHPLVSLFVSMTTSGIMIVVLGNIRASELPQMLKSMLYIGGSKG